MKLCLEMEIPCGIKYEKLLYEITTDILSLENIKLKNCTFDKIKGIILENIEESLLRYSIYKSNKEIEIKLNFSGNKEETINFK